MNKWICKNQLSLILQQIFAAHCTDARCSLDWIHQYEFVDHNTYNTDKRNTYHPTITFFKIIFNSSSKKIVRILGFTMLQPQDPTFQHLPLKPLKPQWPHGHRDVPRGVPGEVARSRSAARGGLAAVHHTGPGAAASKPPGGRKAAAVYVALGGEEWERRAALLGALSH